MQVIMKVIDVIKHGKYNLNILCRVTIKCNVGVVWTLKTWGWEDLLPGGSLWSRGGGVEQV